MALSFIAPVAAFFIPLKPGRAAPPTNQRQTTEEVQLTSHLSTTKKKGMHNS